jgi:hypothetical protein
MHKMLENQSYKPTFKVIKTFGTQMIMEASRK